MEHPVYVHRAVFVPNRLLGGTIVSRRHQSEPCEPVRNVLNLRLQVGVRNQAQPRPLRPPHSR